jgi:hypothetical protein
LIFAAVVLGCAALAACGGDDNQGTDRSPLAPTPPPSLSPTPTPPPAQYVATPVPFSLTQSRTFDVLGWDSWPSAPEPSAIQFRWNAAINKYEVREASSPDWNRLEALESRFGGAPYQYDVFRSDGMRLPFQIPLWAGLPDWYVGSARIFEGSLARAYFAFGVATETGDVPVSGILTCDFGEDEIGEGRLTFDLAAGTVSGWVEPFWGQGLRHPLVQPSFTPGGTTFATTFGTDGVLEGRFFGPRAAYVAVRAGGGRGFAALTGIMTGVCTK